MKRCSLFFTIVLLLTNGEFLTLFLQSVRIPSSKRATPNVDSGHISMAARILQAAVRGCLTRTRYLFMVLKTELERLTKWNKARIQSARRRKELLRISPKKNESGEDLVLPQILVSEPSATSKAKRKKISGKQLKRSMEVLQSTLGAGHNISFF